jgi:hypothetical protein
MENKDLIRIVKMLLDIIIQTDTQQAVTSLTHKSWISPPGIPSFIVQKDRGTDYEILMKLLYANDPFIAVNFSVKTAYEHIEKKLLQVKRSDQPIDVNFINSLFKELHAIKPENKKVYTPISGVRLAKGTSFHLGVYEFCLSTKFVIPVNIDQCLCIGVLLENIYDDNFAMEFATNLFIDFCRLVHFYLGRFDNQHVVKFGLPLYPSYTQTHIYVESSSFIILDDDDKFHSSSINTKSSEVIDIDNIFFTQHPELGSIWDTHKTSLKCGSGLTNKQRKDFNKKLDTRIVNASIATGEVAKNEDVKNSMIYACVALETLLSYDNNIFINNDTTFIDRIRSSMRYIFSKKKKGIGITERMALSMSFILGKNKESSDFIYKRVKELYGLRSAMVHGGQKSITMAESAELGGYVRAAIAKILRDPRFAGMKTIDELWSLIITSKIL